jgi:enoyl-CoA hydratase/carnithine racemase
MADADLVLVEQAGAVRTLTLNRPGQLNAFDQALCGALTSAVADAEADDTVSVVVITGAGRAFSAGTDLVELDASGDFRGDDVDPERFERLIDRLVEFSKPLLCAVNGIGVGIGATMLGLADLVVIAEGARLKCPFTQLAIVPEAGASVTFPSLMGRQNATWMLMSSEWVSAADAVSIGLAWKAVPDDDVLVVTLDHAQRLAAHPLASLVATKRLLVAGSRDAIAAGRRRENTEFDVLLPSPDSRAAVAAFVADRRSSTTSPRQ